MIARLVSVFGVMILMASTPVFAQESLATSKLWYAPILRAYFPSKIPIHGWEYPISGIPCLPADITKFNLSAGTTTAYGVRAFQIRGAITLGPVPAPFEVVDGAQGRRYMLHLQAYLFSPEGRLVWSQQGYPGGGAWMNGSGDSASFTLINSYQGSTNANELIVLAAGDPIFSSIWETRVILGAKRLVLP